MTGFLDELLGGSQVPFLPPDRAAEFFAVKGCVSLVATCLLILHMSITWGTVMRWGQRLRYLCLLYASALLTYASVEQIHEGIPVSWRHMGALGLACMITAAMIVSIRDDYVHPGKHTRAPYHDRMRRSSRTR